MWRKTSYDTLGLPEKEIIDDWTTAFFVFYIVNILLINFIVCKHFFLIIFLNSSWHHTFSYKFIRINVLPRKTYLSRKIIKWPWTFLGRSVSYACLNWRCKLLFMLPLSQMYGGSRTGRKPIWNTFGQNWNRPGPTRCRFGNCTDRTVSRWAGRGRWGR